MKIKIIENNGWGARYDIWNNLASCSLIAFMTWEIVLFLVMGLAFYSAKSVGLELRDVAVFWIGAVLLGIFPGVMANFAEGRANKAYRDFANARDANKALEYKMGHRLFTALGELAALKCALHIAVPFGGGTITYVPKVSLIPGMTVGKTMIVVQGRDSIEITTENALLVPVRVLDAVEVALTNEHAIALGNAGIARDVLADLSMT
jgi:hypothetical protein